VPLAGLGEHLRGEVVDHGKLSGPWSARSALLARNKMLELIGEQRDECHMSKKELADRDGLWTGGTSNTAWRLRRTVTMLGADFS
jgi:hypothetical protein